MKNILLIIILLIGTVANLSASEIEENKKACDDGYAQGCINLGFMYDKGIEVKQDYAKALKFYSRACDSGNIGGCSNLGTLYEHGKGVKQDYTKAVKLYTKACDGGYALGCSNLGFMYTDGRGVKQSNLKAKELYVKACDAGDGSGCFNIGFMYEKSLGVEQDYTKAMKLYAKACDFGDARGCINLGLMYDNGKGVKQDYTKGIKLYTKACNSGYSQGCTNLGFIYAKGRGVVKKDYIRAVDFFSKACDAGDTQSCENYSVLKEKLSNKKQYKSNSINNKKNEISGNFIKIKLPKNISIELPKNWVVINDNKRITLDTAVDAMLDLSNVEQPESTLPFASNYYEEGKTVAMVSFRYYPNQNVTQDNVKQLSEQDIETVDKLLKEEIEKSSEIVGFEVLSWEGSKLQNINGVTVIVTEYHRSSTITKGAIFRVRLIRVLDGKNSFTLIVSYDTSKKIFMKPISSKIINSLKTSKKTLKYSSPEKAIILGKDLFAKVGFYIECGEKKITKTNSNAARWAGSRASNYLVTVGVDIEEGRKIDKEWITKGENGILVRDPNESDKTFEVDFNQKTCQYVKTIIDTGFNLMESHVYKKEH